MATSFTALMRSAREERGSLSVEVPDDWMQGRSAFGGLQVALALRAMRGLVPGLPLRTVQAVFYAPVPAGPRRVRAQVMRSGANVTHAEARVEGDGGATLALVIGVFGAARRSAVQVTPEQPAVAASETIELPRVPGITPSFTQQFDVRWLRGRPPFSGDSARAHTVEVSLVDEGPVTEGHIMLIADFMPPLGLSHLRAPAPGSTLTWMLEIFDHRFEHLPLAGWRVDAELLAARDGYTSQTTAIWAPGAVPVAAGRQCMVIFG
ncbi:MAG TPA: thioesterase family protein [Kofleriaceae bacterium]|nr:thioesterase family protein [Kofleriaceae bacterium]